MGRLKHSCQYVSRHVDQSIDMSFTELARLFPTVRDLLFVDRLDLLSIESGVPPSEST